MQTRSVLIEAENFEDIGGWRRDTQFVAEMGSPYLLAHGLGNPVADAVTRVRLPAPGRWHVWARTKDWVARWNAPGAPGSFRVLADGNPLPAVFGTEGADWHWQYGGFFETGRDTVTLALRDLTGFDGRCDALVLSADDAPPPEAVDRAWRLRMLGLPAQPADAGVFDLAVIGGEYAGMCAAVAAARRGLSVALVEDRAVFGGNNTHEIGVPLRGLLVPGPYAVGRVVADLQLDSADNAQKPTPESDAHHGAVLSAEPNLRLFSGYFAEAAETEGDLIRSVTVLDTKTGALLRICAGLFADCTGHGTLGALAGADFDMVRRGHSGMSNMWRWEMSDRPAPFPGTPWALDLRMGDFPYPGSFQGGWNWESGFDRHAADELELVRDHNLRAVFGAWNAMKNREGAAEHQNARLLHVASVGGTRESRRLLGDLVLRAEHLLGRATFEDGFVPVTWHLDRHGPNPEYTGQYEPFIAAAIPPPFEDAGRRPRHGDPWWGIPYRCLYSRNIGNLFMAGRCISADPWAFGAVRVMRTCGMTGEVAGTAAALCTELRCLPRALYRDHLEQLKEALR